MCRTDSTDLEHIFATPPSNSSHQELYSILSPHGTAGTTIGSTWGPRATGGSPGGGPKASWDGTMDGMLVQQEFERYILDLLQHL